MTEIKADIDFIELAKDVREIKSALMGDYGLVCRVNKLEKGLPLIAAVFSALGAMISHFIGIFKG